MKNKTQKYSFYRDLNPRDSANSAVRITSSTTRVQYSERCSPSIPLLSLFRERREPRRRGDRMRHSRFHLRD